MMFNIKGTAGNCVSYLVIMKNANDCCPAFAGHVYQLNHYAAVVCIE